MALRPIVLLPLLLASTAWCQYNTKEIILDPTKHDEEFLSFRSRPDIEAPRWVSKVYNASALAPGYWFTSPYGIVKQTSNQHQYVAPIIYDPKDGGLVWNGGREVDYCNVYSLQVARYHGEAMLAYLQPEESHGVLMNSHYKPVRHVRADAGGVDGNMHEFQIVDDGTRAVYMTTTHRKVSRRESRTNFGHDGECHVVFNGFKERDLETDEVLFSWDSVDHIALSETYAFPVPEGYPQYAISDMCNNEWGVDYIHGNSIDKLPDGDYLISARSMSAIYKISHVDGSVVWRLGGRRSDFAFTKGTHFSAQHDARCLFQNETHMTISMMDNAVGVYEDVGYTSNPNSRGLVISLDLTAMMATELRHYDHPGGVGAYAFERGNVQTLPGGNVFISWTLSGQHSEYTADGTLIAEAKFLTPLKSYRSYKFPWIGYGRLKPDVHSQVVSTDGAIQTVVRVSWNGDTEATHWNLYGTDASSGTQTLLATTKRTGFETTITHEAYLPYVRVDAVAQNGRPVDNSRSDVIQPVFVPEAGATELALPGAATTITKTRTWFRAAATTIYLPSKATATQTGTDARAPSGHGGWQRLGDNLPRNPLLPILEGILVGILLFFGIRRMRRPQVLQRIRRPFAHSAPPEDDESRHSSGELGLLHPVGEDEGKES